MPDTSPNLALPYLMPAQAQKHVTHNEALQRLDAVTQLVVEAFGVSTPPVNPGLGLVWAIGAGATGEWAGKAGKLALRVAAGWVFLDPLEGWRAWGRAEAQLRVWRGASWQPQPFENIAGLGIATTSDATNRLSVVAPASLFSHDGGGHQMKLNKAAAAQTVSLLYQNNWSGRAELGLAGTDDFSIKVSGDGSTWTTALSIAQVSGVVSLPAGALLGGAVPYTRGNVLGAVAQSAGAPTGALMQRSSNSNGLFVRFADGTQICSHSLTASAAAAVTWTYPVAFAAAPTVIGTAQAAVLSCVMLDTVPTPTSAALSARDKVDARRADVLSVTAIGRWF